MLRHKEGHCYKSSTWCATAQVGPKYFYRCTKSICKFISFSIYFLNIVTTSKQICFEWQLAVLLFVLARCGGSITIWKMAKLGEFPLGNVYILTVKNGWFHFHWLYNVFCLFISHLSCGKNVGIGTQLGRSKRTYIYMCGHIYIVKNYLSQKLMWRTYWNMIKKRTYNDMIK